MGASLCIGDYILPLMQISQPPLASFASRMSKFLALT